MLSARRIAPLIVLAFATACGGGGQSSPTSAPPKAAAPATASAPSPSPLVGPSPAPAAPKPATVPSPVSSPSPSPSPTGGVTAELRDASGNAVGTASFAAESGGVRVFAQVRSLPPGPHGIHVHMVGACDPPDFMTAGGHFNPTNHQHGIQNPNGPHAGDLPNVEINNDGTGRLDMLARDLSLGSGTNSVFDADGSALVIHAGPDDYTTDPAGNSGARIACGLIRRG